MEILSNTKIIPETARIFRVYSGRDSRYFEKFIDDGLVFLDFPSNYFNLDSLNRNNRQAFLAMVEANLNEAASGEALQFDRRVEDFVGKKPVGNSLGQLGASANLLFRQAQKGDLVLVPISGSTRMKIGEIITDFSPDDAIQIEKYGEHWLPARKVKWLQNELNRNTLPKELRKRLELSRAVNEIRPEAEPQIIYEYAYDSVIYGQRSSIRIGAPSHRDDLSAIADLSQLIAFWIEAFAAVNGSDIQSLTGAIDVRRFSQQNAHTKYDVDVRLNFNSPGIVHVRANNPNLGRFIAVGLLVATVGFAGCAENGIKTSTTNLNGEVLSEIEISYAKEVDASVNLATQSIGAPMQAQLEDRALVANQKLKMKIPIQRKE
jgi:hypothetical protein